MKINGTLVEGGSEVLTTCPQCGREKLYVNIRKRLGHCVYCKANYNTDAVRQLGIEEEVQSFAIRLGSGRRPLTLENPWKHPEAKAYLRRRGVKEPHGDICYDPESRRLLFQIRCPLGVGVHAPAWHTRSIDEGKGWVVLPGVQKQNYWWGYCCGPVATICEGIFDAIAIQNRGGLAVALLGTAFSPAHLEGLVHWVKNGILKQVVVWMDDDEAGHTAREKIAAQLEPIVPTVVVIEDYPEPSETDEFPEECFKVCG